MEQKSVIPAIFIKDGELNTSSEEMKAEFVEITPFLAKQLLSFNTLNRKISEQYVSQLIESIKAGKFETTHQGISFYKDGTLADGQHRLMAISEAGKPLKILVTVGMEPSSHIDIGRKRSEADSLRIASKENEWINSYVMARVNVISANFPALGLTTIDKKAEYVNSFKEAFQFVGKIYTRGATIKHLNSSAIAASFICAYIDGADETKLAQAARLLQTGLAPDEDVDPYMNTIIALRNFVMNRQFSGGAGTNKTLFFAAAQALSNYLQDKNVKKIILPDKFPFTIYDASCNEVYSPKKKRK